jgi:hypothetical protein
MYIAVRNTKARIALALIPIIFFLIIYFTVIKPDQNTANQAVTQGLQQVNQQVQHDSAAPANVKLLTACLAAAGTNVSAVEQCRAKFQN